jgi:hypothetical protein
MGTPLPSAWTTRIVPTGRYRSRHRRLRIEVGDILRSLCNTDFESLEAEPQPQDVFQPRLTLTASLGGHPIGCPLA